MKPNPAADRVRTWDRIWGAFIHAKQIGDTALLAAAKRAIEAFDKETGAQPLACTR
jgi:hypothetical protein